MAERTDEDPRPHMDLDNHQYDVLDLESCVWSYAITEVHGIGLLVDTSHCEYTMRLSSISIQQCESQY